jgi:hypothetical protein
MDGAIDEGQLSMLPAIDDEQLGPDGDRPTDTRESIPGDGHSSRT